MPPLYPYTCDECKTAVEVIRSFAEYENPPTVEEAPECTNETKVHKWKRQIGASIRAFRGAGWRGAKGYW